jgi:nuclear pore complex protein Nup62
MHFSTTQAVAAVSATSYRQLEEAINKWTLELEEQEKVFLNQATQVNAWDRMLVGNGENIVSLNEAVEKVKLDQQVTSNDDHYFVCGYGYFTISSMF